MSLRMGFIAAAMVFYFSPALLGSGGTASAASILKITPGVGSLSLVQEVQGRRRGARRGRRGRNRGRNRRRGRNFAIGLGAAALTLGVIGAISASERNAAWRRHVDRCYRRYRSYNHRTDTFRGFDGRDHRCRL